MVADSNKKPARDEKEVENVVRVGGKQSSTSRNFSLRRFGNKKFIFGFLAILIVGAAIFLINNNAHVSKNIYAEAAGHKIYKNDVDDLIGKNQNVSANQAATVLANKYLTEAMGKDQGVTVTTEDIQNAYGPSVNIDKQRSINPYTYQVQVNQLYFTKLQAHYQGSYKGDLLVAHFSRFIAVQPLTAEDKAAFPQLGNPAAIAKDKNYARVFITDLYNKVQSNKLTFTQAEQTERNDPVLGEKMYPALSHSGPFDTSQAPNSLLNVTSIRQQISDIKPDQMTKPFIVKVSNQSANGATQSFDSYYLVVRMDTSSGGHGDGNFQQYLNESKKKLGYKVYV